MKPLFWTLWALVLLAVATFLVTAADEPERTHKVRTVSTTTSTSTTTSAPPTTVAPTTTTTAHLHTTTTRPAPRATTTRAWTWDDLADCESGEWDADRVPVRGSANWADTRNGHQGGVHFAPSTWDRYRLHWLKDPTLPADANLASREQQIRVAEKVLELEGPGAWPKCSYLVGMR